MYMKSKSTFGRSTSALKRTVIGLAIILFIAPTACSQSLSVSVLGDSYSTFDGYITPSTNETWYYQGNRGNNDVSDVTQTWWWQFINNNGLRLCVNNSWSGATIGYYGYDGNDYSARSFITRSDNLGCPDVILIFGGTNDSWAGAPIGAYKYDKLRRDDYFFYRPALAHLLEHMKKRYPNVELVFMINSELSDDVTESTKTICDHYGVHWILLHDIDKQSGHPSQKGMKAIATQLTEKFKDWKLLKDE